MIYLLSLCIIKKIFILINKTFLVLLLIVSVLFLLVETIILIKINITVSFFIDNLFGFEQYKTYSQLVRALLIKESTNSNVNKACNNSLIYNFDILDNLKNNNINIPRQTVYNWIKNLILLKVNYGPIETNDTLYVMADEK